MPRKYTAEELIAQVRDEARIPNTASTGNTDADILNRINEFVLGYLSGIVMEVRDEYFVRTIRQPLSASKTKYRIPSRAMYQKLRDVRYKTGSNGYQALAHIDLSSLDRERYSLTATNTPSGFRIEGNYVVLWPEMNTSPQGSIDMAFYFAPGELVKSTDAALVTGVSGNTATCTGIPDAWATTDKFDVHSPDSGAEIKVWDRTASAVGTGTGDIVFNTIIDGTEFGEFPVEEGDYLTLAGEAALPAVPRELHPLIGVGAACSILEDEGDLEVFAAKTATLNRRLFGNGATTRGAIGQMEHRVEVRPKFVKGGRLIEGQRWWS